MGEDLSVNSFGPRAIYRDRYRSGVDYRQVSAWTAWIIAKVSAGQACIIAEVIVLKAIRIAKFIGRFSLVLR